MIHSQTSNKVAITLFQHQVLALVDTGASVSCISHQLYKDLNIQSTYPLQPTHISNIKGIKQSRIEVLGQINIPFHLQDFSSGHTFLVLDMVNVPIILGLDYLIKNKVTIELDPPQLIFKHNNFTVPLCQDNEVDIAVAKQLIAIPPKSETLLTLSVDNEWNGKSIILEPRQSFVEAWGLVPARTLSTVSNGTVITKILNPTLEELTIVPGTVVGYLQPLVNPVISPPTPSPPLVASLDPSTVSTSVKHQLKDELGISLNEANLTDRQKEELAGFLLSNRDVFATNLKELGHTHLQTMPIDTQQHPPVKMRPYRASPVVKKEIDKQVTEMLENGIISPSTSPYASPVVMVKKKNGEYRFAIDYRKLNSITSTINYPLPLFEDCVDLLHGSTIFSVLDLMSGFWQIPMAEDAKPKTAFICHSGLYEFERMPFGLKNSPVIFQSIMENALRGLNYKSALVYVDDIIVFSRNFDQHLEHLSDLFSHLRAANLTMKPSKCQFAVEEVLYLGHVISKNGVSTDPKKVDLVQNFPTPTTQKDVRSFLGLASYYRKFIKDFAHIAHPLNALLSKDTSFSWNEQCQNSFDQLKQALTSAPILAFPNFDRQFILYTDASATAIGYVLGQIDDEGRERVINYGGRALRPAERKWSISERECLAVIDGIKHNRVYLAHRKFIVKTDHSAIQYLNGTKDLSGRLGRWMLFLQGYTFDVEYRPGKLHGNADALSRLPYAEVPEDDSEEVGQLPALFSPPLLSQADKPPQSHLLSSDQIEKVQTSDDIRHTQNDSTQEISSLCVEPGSQIHAGFKTGTDCTDSKSVSPSVNVAIDNDNWCEEKVYFLDTTSPSVVSRLQLNDAQAAPLIQYLQQGILPADQRIARRIMLDAQDHVIDNQILYHLWYPRGPGHLHERVVRQLVVPHALRNDVLLSYHDSFMAGAHQGVDRTYQSIRLKYFWPNMYHDITTYVKSCLDCQQAKRNYAGKRPPLLPLPVTSLFQRLHIDFIGPLEPSTEGYKYILVIIDAYSKWPEAFPLVSSEATEVAWVLYREIFCRYGAPDTLLSDRGKNFLSKLVTELCAIFQITKLKTSAYHPQTNAQCERFNSSLITSLRAMCEENTKDWAKRLPAVLSAYRVTPSTESTQFTPYFLLFKKECRLPLDVALVPPADLPASAEACMQDILTNFQTTQDLVRENLSKAQIKYKTQYDKTAKPHKFLVGQKVWVYTPKIQVGKSKKLLRKWTGPYYICLELPGNTFLLRRSQDNKQLGSPVHALRLKPFFDPNNRPTNVLSDMTDADTLSDTDSERQSVVTSDRGSKSDNGESDNDDAATSSRSSHSSRSSISNSSSSNTDTDNSDVERQSDSQTNLYEVDKIIKTKVVNKKRLYCIKWKGYPQTTWEPAENIPDHIIEHFHINKTMQGRSRRRPQR